jgi:Zn-dependent peptidase ImmA (M78 family)
MVVGARLKMARKMAGMSQQDLGEKVGVSRMAVSKYERDQITPDSQNLIKLAQALGVNVEYLLRPIEVTLAEPIFRKRVRLGKKEQAAIIERTRDWIERYLDIESLFGESPEFHPPQINLQVASLDDVERAALDLRHEWDLGVDSIDNVMETLEMEGIKVHIIEGADEFDALTIWVNQSLPVIVVKDGVPGDRQRFNLAHELGHLLLEIDGNVDEESAANRFAGAFLAPRPAVYEELGHHRQTLNMRELHLLKHKYGLSMQAWIYRAKDLGIISESRCRQLFITFRQRDWHREEPGDEYPPERPHRMRQMVLRALAENVISPMRAEEILGAPLEPLEA